MSKESLPTHTNHPPTTTTARRLKQWSILFTLSLLLTTLNWLSPSIRSSLSAPSLPTSLGNPPPPITHHTFHTRQLTLAQTLLDLNISAYISEPSPNSLYYYNISTSSWRLSERPFLFVLVPARSANGSVEARVKVVVPSFEKTRAKTQLEIAVRPDAIEYLPWEESESPYGALEEFVERDREGRATVLVDENSRVLIMSEVQEALGSDVVVKSSVAEVRSLRERKTEEELALLRFTNELTLHVIGTLRDKLYLGITEREALKLLEQTFASVGMPANAALPHGSSSNRVLQKEDLILVDAGGKYGGYIADVTRTFALPSSSIPQKHLDIWHLVKKAQKAAYDAVESGVKASEIDQAARTVIEDAGLGRFFTHRLGHGIGLEVHEAPYLHAGNSKTNVLPGNTFSNEPGVYIEGKVGVRLEDCWFMNDQGRAVKFTGQAKSPWEI